MAHWWVRYMHGKRISAMIRTYLIGKEQSQNGYTSLKPSSYPHKCMQHSFARFSPLQAQVSQVFNIDLFLWNTVIREPTLQQASGLRSASRMIIKMVNEISLLCRCIYVKQFWVERISKLPRHYSVSCWSWPIAFSNGLYRQTISHRFH